MLSDYEKEVLESIQRKLARVELALGQYEKALISILERERKIMVSLSDLVGKVTSQGAALDKLATGVGVLASQANGTTLPPNQQAIVDTVAADLAANDTKLGALQATVDAAITPPPPPPPPPVTPPATPPS